MGPPNLNSKKKMDIFISQFIQNQEKLTKFTMVINRNVLTGKRHVVISSTSAGKSCNSSSRIGDFAMKVWIQLRNNNIDERI